MVFSHGAKLVGNEGRFSQVWINVEEGLHFTQSQMRRTQYLWLVACDANMELDVFSQGIWYDDKYMTITTPRGSSTCCSVSHGRKMVERLCDSVSLQMFGEDVMDMEAVFGVMLETVRKTLKLVRYRKRYQEYVADSFLDAMKHLIVVIHTENVCFPSKQHRGKTQCIGQEAGFVNHMVARTRKKQFRLFSRIVLR